MSRGCPVIPHSDVVAQSSRAPTRDPGNTRLLSSRTFGKHILHLFIISFFSLPNRLRCGHPVQVLDRYTSAQTSFSHVRPSPPFFFPLSPIGRTGLRVLVIAPDTVIWSSRTPTRDPENTGKFTRKILFPGPSIAVRGDTVLDAVSRIYPLFIPKENRRQYRPGQ